MESKSERLASLLNGEIKKGKTQAELARAIGIRHNALNTYLRESCVPSDVSVGKLAQYFKLSREQFLYFLEFGDTKEEKLKTDLGSDVYSICSYLNSSLGVLQRLELAKLLIESSQEQLILV